MNDESPARWRGFDFYESIGRCVEFEKLEFTYFLSGKKVIAAPAIPIIAKIKDHLKDKSKNGAFPKPSIKRMLTNIIAMPCSCFFIKSYSFVIFKFG